MMLIRSFFRRITKDFQQRELLPLKLIFFVQASTLFVLYPYLTIHMRELGINVEETAIMSAVTPFVAIVMPPLAGLVADRIGNFKILLSIFSSLGGAAALLLLLVPVGRVTVKYPEQVVMDLGCPESNGNLIYTINQMDQNCQRESEVDDEMIMRIESCGYMCQVNLQNQTIDLPSILSSRTYTVNYHDPTMDHNYLFKYNRPSADFMHTTMNESEIKEHRLLRNKEFYKTSIRQLSKNNLYFPTDQLYKFSCSIDQNNTIFFNSSQDELLIDEDKLIDRGNLTICKFDNFFLANPDETRQNNEYLPFKMKIKALDATKTDDSEEKRRFQAMEMMLTDDNEFNSLKCENSDDRSRRVTVTVDLKLNSEVYDTVNIDMCYERCIVTASRRNLCSNMDTVMEYNIQLTFWLYLVIRVFIGIIGGTAFAMFEGAVIAILREQKADYGLQRIYGSIGAMISSPLSGLLIDYASRGKEYTDFRPAFYLYAALKMASGVLMLAINLEFKAPAHNVVGDVISVLKNIEISALMLACFVLGTAWGYIESFLFWLIQDLGGSRSLMGITITVGGIAGIPLLVLSGPIINKIGHANVLVVGFVFYAIRLLGYSMIYNPWHCLIFEALESVTSSLSFTAAVTYAAKLSTTSTDTSIQGLLGGLYYGVGKGSGSLIGGFLMKAFGTRPTYQIFAAVSLITGVIYFLFNGLYLKRRPQVEGNDIVKKKPKEKPVENGIESAIDRVIENGKEKHEYRRDISSNKTKNSNKIKHNDEITLKNLKGQDNLAFDNTQMENANKNNEIIECNPELLNKQCEENGNTSVGRTNVAFDNDTKQCDVTIESEPKQM